MSSRKNCHVINNISDLYEIYPYLLWGYEFPEAVFEDDVMKLFLSLLMRVTAVTDYALNNVKTPGCPREPELRRKLDLCDETLKELSSKILHAQIEGRDVTLPTLRRNSLKNNKKIGGVNYEVSNQNI